MPELPSLLEEPLPLLEESSDELELLPESELLILSSDEEESDEDLLLLLLSLRRFLVGFTCLGLSSSNSSEGAR